MKKALGYIRIIMERLAFTLMLIFMIPAMLVPEMLEDSVKRTIASVLIGLLVFFAIMLLFAFLPAKHRTLRSQLPGTILTVLCWFAFTDMFAFFISQSYKYSNVYGPIAAMFLLILWLRYMVLILFAGSAVNHTAEK